MSPSRGRILVVDDEEDIRENLADRLGLEGFEVLLAADGEEAVRRIRQEDPDVVLLDLQMPRMGGMEVLHRLEGDGLDTTVVILTAYGTIEKAVQAMKAGAYDFITKPFDKDHIRIVVGKAVERERLRRDNIFLREQAEGAVPVLVGDSPSMQDVLKIARRVADSTATILLLGESGTGKEVLARHMHQWSARRERPFVAVNCVALPDHLLESELFGHEKGAFTGATQQKKGWLEAARWGTILLDEIGSTQPSFQLKLLRFLQEGTIERVGGDHSIVVDARVIAATNRDLEKAMAEGEFLTDLFYRLNVVSIRLPPLRERREDIPALAEFFLKKYVHEAKRDVVGISDEALESLRNYDWPGNIRELEHAIEHGVLLGSEEEIWPEDLPEQVLGARGYQPQDDDTSYRAAVEECRRRIIQEALQQTQGNQSQAAKRLGLQRTHLSKLMKNLGLR